MYIRGIKREGLASDEDLGGLRIGLVSAVLTIAYSFVVQLPGRFRTLLI